MSEETHKKALRKKTDLKSPSLNELFNNLINNNEEKHLSQYNHREFMLSIARIGNNINQIAYHLNSTNRDKNFLSSKLDEVIELQKLIIKKGVK